MRCAFLLLLPVVFGCAKTEDSTSTKVPVPLADIAPNLREKAQQELPDVVFDSARKIKENGEDVYEIRGKQPNGKVREVEVSASGEIIEVE